MARKVFLSFLGANFYSDTIYCKGEFSSKTKYIQKATLELIGANDWQSDDVVRIFVTDLAETANWTRELDTRKDRNNEDKPYIRLQKVIDDMHLEADVKDVKVPDGNTENEIWRIFKIMYEEINDGDELYIDLTHAFRYLPMLMLVLANYTKFLKNITVKSITYGNFEGRDKEKNRAPIVDLMSLVMLQDWTTAAADFINNGNAKGLKQVIKDKLTPLFKDPSKQKGDERNINNIGLTIENFTADRITCRGLKISEGKDVCNLNNQLEEIKKTSIAPLDPIIRKVKETTLNAETAPARCYVAAKWCFERKLYQQAVTILQEGVNTLFCLRHGIEIDDQEKRDYVGQAIHCRKEQLDNERNNKNKKGKPHVQKITDILSDKLLESYDFVNAYEQLSAVRNDYNHAGFRKKKNKNQEKPLKNKELISKIENALLFFEKPMLTADCTPQDAHKEFPPVFLNLSNHPSAEWEKKQIEAARKYGEVVDEQFPQVNPEDSIDDIKNLAEKTAGALVERYGNEALTVHVMGEMTLTCELVRLLKDAGVRCLASCTQRNVEDKGNGDKVSHFKFVQFREY